MIPIFPFDKSSNGKETLHRYFCRTTNVLRRLSLRIERRVNDNGVKQPLSMLYRLPAISIRRAVAPKLPFPRDMRWSGARRLQSTFAATPPQ